METEIKKIVHDDTKHVPLEFLRISIDRKFFKRFMSTGTRCLRNS